MENGLTLLANASLPLMFWNESFRTTVFLINRLPSSILKGQTPLEKLFHTQPNYHTLRVFGCSCYPNIRSFNQHKLACRSIQCIFLGYILNHKGYKYLDPAGKIIISRNVHFDESTFPYTSKSYSTTVSANTTHCCPPDCVVFILLTLLILINMMRHLIQYMLMLQLFILMHPFPLKLRVLM